MVVDTLGEMLKLYTLADLVFVGGSLVPTGGHNVLEASLVKKPVLFGPYMQNFKEIARLLRQREFVFFFTRMGEGGEGTAADPEADTPATALYEMGQYVSVVFGRRHGGAWSDPLGHAEMASALRTSSTSTTSSPLRRGR